MELILNSNFENLNYTEMEFLNGGGALGYTLNMLEHAGSIFGIEAGVTSILLEAGLLSLGACTGLSLVAAGWLVYQAYATAKSEGLI